MKILPLTQRIIFKNIEHLIAIDKTIIDEEGTWVLDNFLRDLYHKWDYSFIAIENNLIVGFIICSIKENDLYIHRLAILPEFQCKNIGKKLLDLINKLGIKNEFESIKLQVKKFNINAQRFYEKNEFEMKGFNGPNIIYIKRLK